MHNLRNVDLDIPRDRLVVITGLSGSGKSSLAFDTLYAEGQRRYVESLSAYARQFLGQVDKPDVDRIDGLSPAIAIDQKTTSQNPRSTVGTITEIHDHLRLLYARIGTAHCPRCAVPLAEGGIDNAVDEIVSRYTGRALVLAPVVDGKKGVHQEVLDAALAAGYTRARLDGDIVELPHTSTLAKQRRHTVEIVVDRIVIGSERSATRRIAASIETAVAYTGGAAVVEAADGSWRHLVATRNSCPQCAAAYPDLEPRTFSFNSPFGACTACDGLGTIMEGDEARFVPDPTLPVAEAISCFAGSSWSAGYQRAALGAMLRSEGVPKRTTWATMDADTRALVLYGSDLTYPSGKWQLRYAGVLPWLAQRRHEAEQDPTRTQAGQWVAQWMSERPCGTCSGRRLNPLALAVTVAGRNISDVEHLPLDAFAEWVSGITLDARRARIADRLLREIAARAGFLLEVGLSYLSLDRTARTLSGGEAQRIRLASQVGSGLVGVMYVLDEPSIGLHPRDNQRLLTTLERLRDLGNTVIVVEHDEETIRAADWVVDVGPGAGSGGGTIVASGPAAVVAACDASITGAYLTGRRHIAVPATRRTSTRSITVRGAAENNLRGIDVAIPLGCLVAVTGVSGSGKSTLINETLRPALLNALHGSRHTTGQHLRIEGIDAIDKVIDIDQSPIGRTPRSNPATYTGVFDKIRALYAATEEARVRGWTPGRFSFNVAGGRCEACNGDGELRIEMHFLPDVYVPCEECNGTRFRADTLEVVFKQRNIAEVLQMSVDEARTHFAAQPSIARTLDVLHDVGLGYVRLGQSATQLSGGEAQRIKLAEQLQRRSTGRTLYLLDEPTTGLHFEDVHKLVEVLDRLVDSGNTVLVVEHNLDVVKRADWVIDLGPEGGSGGGSIVATGTPEQVAAVPGSHTGTHLQHLLGASP